MKTPSLLLLNIAPLLPDRLDEIVADLVRLRDAEAISCVAFSCTLVPEGEPPHDKAARYAELFARYRDQLSPHGLPAGILLQATMGHGWKPDESASFQRLVLGDGTQPYIFCPLDADFQSYVSAAVRTLAEQRPAFMMLDDDTRMLTGRDGCFCPLHLAQFNRGSGTSFTRECLLGELDTDPELARRYDDVLRASVVRLAQTVRRAMDAVDPALAGSFCLCADDVRHAPEMTRTLAAPGQVPMVRINHALYKQDSPRTFPAWRLHTARQFIWLPGEFQVLAEPDTCPHNRYSTSAAILHAHLTWSFLQGLHGAKLWITRMHRFEPGSGKAYRDALMRQAGFYRTLSRLRPTWISPCEPLPHKPPFNFPRRAFASQPRQNWGSDVFGRMGIPCHYATVDDPAPKLMAARDVDELNDDELRQALAGNVLLDGAAAVTLNERGFSSWIGVEAKPWSGPAVTGELWREETLRAGGASFVDLRSRQPGSEVLSLLFHAPYELGLHRDEVGPGALWWQNAAGGTVITLAACLMPYSAGFTPFTMLNEGRKAQFVEFLSRLDALPVYIPGDAEIMLEVGRLADGSYLVAGLNIGLDPLSTLSLAGTLLRESFLIENLAPDGHWESAPAIWREGGFTLDLAVPACAPFVVRLRP